MKKGVQVRLRIQVRPEVGVVGKLAGEFLDQNFMAVNRASKRARRRTTVGTRLVAMANLTAVVTAVFLGENLANIFSGRGEVIRERSFGVMVVTDRVGESRRIGRGSGHFATRNSAFRSHASYPICIPTSSSHEGRGCQGRLRGRLKPFEHH